MEDIKYWAALNLVPRLGTVRFRRLEAHFGSLEYAWTAGLADLKDSGVDDRIVRDLEVG